MSGSRGSSLVSALLAYALFVAVVVPLMGMYRQLVNKTLEIETTQETVVVDEQDMYNLP